MLKTPNKVLQWRINYREVLRGEVLSILFACDQGWATKDDTGSKYTQDDMKAMIDVLYQLSDHDRVQSSDLDTLMEEFRDSKEGVFTAQVKIEAVSSDTHSGWHARAREVYQMTPMGAPS